MEKAKIGIVGLGWIAQVFHLPILTKIPDATISCVCDKDRSRARALAEKYGITREAQDAFALESQKHVGGKLSPPVIGRYPEVFQSLFDTLGPRGWFCIGLMELGARPIGSLCACRKNC